MGGDRDGGAVADYWAEAPHGGHVRGVYAWRRGRVNYRHIVAPSYWYLTTFLA